MTVKEFRLCTHNVSRLIITEYDEELVDLNVITILNQDDHFWSTKYHSEYDDCEIVEIYPGDDPDDIVIDIILPSTKIFDNMMESIREYFQDMGIHDVMEEGIMELLLALVPYEEMSNKEYVETVNDAIEGLKNRITFIIDDEETE